MSIASAILQKWVVDCLAGGLSSVDRSARGIADAVSWGTSEASLWQRLAGALAGSCVFGVAGSVKLEDEPLTELLDSIRRFARKSHIASSTRPQAKIHLCQPLSQSRMPWSFIYLSCSPLNCRLETGVLVLSHLLQHERYWGWLMTSACRICSILLRNSHISALSECTSFGIWQRKLSECSPLSP